MFLTAAEVARITGRVRFAAQRRALDGLGIRYLTAATGEPLVRASDIGRESVGSRRAPRWDRMTA